MNIADNVKAHPTKEFSMPNTNEPGRSVSSRLLSVLFAFDAGRATLTLADIVRRTGLPHATARRFALELVEAGALERSGTGHYSLHLEDDFLRPGQ
jgi:hypothetical protein